MGSPLQDPSVPAASVEIPAELLRGAPAAPPVHHEELRKLESRKIGQGDAPEAGVGGALGATVLVVGLLLGAFLLLRKLLGRSRLFAPGTAMRVLARRPIAPKQDVILVEIGSRVLVVGATRDSLSRLGEITAADEIAALRSRCGVAPAEPAPARLAHVAAEPAALPAPEENGASFAGIVEELSRIRTTVRDWTRQEAAP